MIRRYGLMGVLGLVLIIGQMVLWAGVPSTNAQIDPTRTPTPTPVPGLDRLDYFRADLRPAFQEDILLFPHAPLYQANLTVTFTATEATLLGTMTIIYTNRSGVALDEIILRLYPNLPSYGGAMLVHYAQLDNQQISPTTDATGSVLSLRPTQPILPAQVVRVVLQYTAIVPADTVNLYAQYSYMNDVLALANVLPLLSVYDPADGWWRGIEHPHGDAVYSEVGYFDVQITAPTDWIWITTGTQLTSTTHPDGSRTTRYIAALVRDFAMMASPNYRTTSGMTLGVQIDVSYLPGGATAAERALQYALDAVEIFSAVFGEYPYQELDIVQTFTTVGGIEYPGLIVAQSDSWNATNAYLEVIVVHEVAHQWWYGLVGNNQPDEPWLDEALAQYSLAYYYAITLGEEAYAGVMANYRQGWQNWQATTGDLPAGLPAAAYDRNGYFHFVYEKGPLLYHALSEDYGRGMVITALGVFAQAYRYDIATIADLQASFEQTLTADLDFYFAAWVLE